MSERFRAELLEGHKRAKLQVGDTASIALEPA